MIRFLLPLAIVGFPLSLLLLFPLEGFSFDWNNSLFLGGYAGQYFRSHLEFPTQFSTNEMIGNPFFLFYGYLLYPLLGGFSSLLGIHLSMRVLIFLTFLTQYFLIHKVTLKFSKNKILAIGTSALTIWSIYPLTNLYNRSALPEFLATSLLLSALCTWILALEATTPKEKWSYTLSFALCISLGAGFHAITALYGSLIVILFVVGTLIGKKNKKEFLLPSLVSGLLYTVILSPWVYVLWKFSGRLRASQSLGRLYYYEGLDEAWVRFFPLPLDWRSVDMGLKTSNPWLDAQVNVPLLLLFGSLALQSYLQNGKKFKSLGFSIGLFLFLAVSVISLCPTLGNFLSPLFKYFQMSYRMVTYCNLFLLFSFLFFLKSNPFKLSTPFLIFCTSLAFFGVFLKLAHAGSPLVQNRHHYKAYKNFKDEVFLKTPKTFYSTSDYFIPEDKTLDLARVKDEARLLPLVPQNGKNFGVPESQEIEIQGPTWIVTNVAPFPWNTLQINGRVLSKAELFGAENTWKSLLNPTPLERALCFFIDTPGKYRISYAFKSDSIYLKLRNLSFLVLLLTLAVLLCLTKTVYGFLTFVRALGAKWRLKTLAVSRIT